MRERAQQSWPAFPKTAYGAAAAAASRSASAKITLADLPPSSSVTRLMDCEASAPTFRPTSVEPVKATLATSGCSTIRSPTVRPGPLTTFSTPSGRPASSASRSRRSAVSGVSSAGFRTTVFPAASAGRHLPRGDREREVPGRDEADDPERLAERHVDAARDGNRVPEQPFRAPRRSTPNTFATIPTSPRASEIGLPTFRASSVASSSAASAIASARAGAGAGRARPGRSPSRRGTPPWRARSPRRPPRPRRAASPRAPPRWPAR